MKRSLPVVPTIFGTALAIAMSLAVPGAIAGPVFDATLLGSNEVPANASTATGTSSVTVLGNTLDVVESFSGLIGGPASAASSGRCSNSDRTSSTTSS
jgi:hypothetical protein